MIYDIKGKYIGAYSLGRGDEFVPALKRLIKLSGVNLEIAGKFNLPTMKDPDYIIVLGGDGTVLRAEREFPGIPKFSIGAGHLSFLSTVEAKALRNAVELFKKGKFRIDERSKIRTNFGDALNEVALLSDTGTISEFNFSMDGIHVDSYRADGMIVATPTGSTAHALSAGGPIVDPHVASFVVVPLAPFRLKWRPFVIPDTSKVTLSVKDGESSLVIDGMHAGKKPKRIEIERSDTPARFVELGIHDHFSKLSKMH